MRQYSGVFIETTVDSKAVLRALQDAIHDGIKDAFEGPVLADAKANSPVGQEHRVGEEITNRESIQVKTVFTRRGPMGKLFSTSGHGGFLEFGTRFMGAQPWAWPAVQKNTGVIIEFIRVKLALSQGPQLGETRPDRLISEL
jgi:HK97 gp10 family phage protein